MFLYNLSQNELTKLRRYFNNILIKERIKHSISSTKISILFIFKKNEEFCLCVDYRNLNAIIVKNQHSLSLITKTLNCLTDFKQFINLILRMFITEFALNAITNEKQLFARATSILNIK